MHMGSLHTCGMGLRQRQSGFNLVELTVAMVVATGLAMVLMSLNMSTTENMRSGFVAQQYRMLSQAVAAYMGRHHAALVALPSECATVLWHADKAPTAPAVSCQLSGLGATAVANGLQPTAGELIALNFLESSFSSQTLLPTRPIMRNASGSLGPAKLSVQITKQCGSTPHCTSGYRLQGMVFNQQPYDFERSIQRGATVRDNMYDAFAAMGGGAAVALASSSAEVAELAGYKSLFKITNPLQSSSGGVPGVLAMRSDFNNLTGVTSSDSMGAYAPSGQMWDFSGQSLRGLNTLAAVTMGVEQLRTNKLTVSGDSELQQVKALALLAEKIKLPAAALGQVCFPQDQSLAMANDGTGRLLVCPSTGEWTYHNPKDGPP
jgi:type II secretory pathway pseudopilin PulG